MSISGFGNGGGGATLQTAGNAILTNIDTKLANPLEVNVGLTDAELRATAVTVGGKSVLKAVTITRPADTIGYAVGDVIADSVGAPTLLEFTNCANVNGGQGYIVKARIMTTLKTCTAKFRLTLYHTAITAIGDNIPKTTLYTSNDKIIGNIDFAAMSTEYATTSTAAFSSSTSILPYICAPANTSIYAVLSTLDTFTPTNAQQFYIELTCELS